MSTLKSSAEDLTLNADGSGNDIKFQSNGVEKASIDQDGNVAASGTITANGQAQLSNNNLIGGNTGATSTWIGKRTSSGDGVQIQTTNASGADTQRLAITCNADSADFTIKDSDIVFGTAGKGICLGVTTNTDANTLDDYEEGEVTNGLDINGTTQTSYSSGRGNIQYTKVGRIVHLQCYLDTEGATLATTGTLHMRLPFAVSAGSGTALVTGQNLFVFYIAGVGDFPVLTYFNEGDTTIHGYRMALPSITGTDYVQTGDIFANTTTSQRIIMKIAMSYQTD